MLDLNSSSLIRDCIYHAGLSVFGSCLWNRQLTPYLPLRSEWNSQPLIAIKNSFPLNIEILLEGHPKIIIFSSPFYIIYLPFIFKKCKSCFFFVCSKIESPASGKKLVYDDWLRRQGRSLGMCGWLSTSCSWKGVIPPPIIDHLLMLNSRLVPSAEA